MSYIQACSQPDLMKAFFFNWGSRLSDEFSICQADINYPAYRTSWPLPNNPCFYCQLRWRQRAQQGAHKSVFSTPGVQIDYPILWPSVKGPELQKIPGPWLCSLWGDWVSPLSIFLFLDSLWLPSYSSQAFDSCVFFTEFLIFPPLPDVEETRLSSSEHQTHFWDVTLGVNEALWPSLP